MSENCPISGSCHIIKNGKISTKDLAGITKQIVLNISVNRAAAALCLASNPGCCLRRQSLENAPVDKRLGPAFAENIEETI